MHLLIYDNSAYVYGFQWLLEYCVILQLNTVH